MKAIKLVVLEKHEFANGDESVLKTILAFFHQQNSNAGTELVVFLTQNYSKRRYFSTDTLVELVKPVVMEKYVFQYRDLSIVKAFWSSGTIRIPTQGTKTQGMFINGLFNQNQSVRLRP